MTRAACIVVQTDETVWLRPWLLHHGALFGYENLYVLDGGSTDLDVLAVLGAFANLGVHVEAGGPNQADKDALVARKLAALGSQGEHDLAVALECSDFLAAIGPGGPAIDREAISSEFARLAAGAGVAIDRSFANIPGRLDVFAFEPSRRVVTPLRPPPVNSSTSPDVGFGLTTLTCFNVSQRPIEGAGSRGRVLIRSMVLRQHLAGLIDIASLPQDWRGADAPSPSAIVLDLDQQPFEEDAYLSANPDIRQAKVSPFRHFLQAGCCEGRRRGLFAGADVEVAERFARLRAGVCDGQAGYAGLARVNRLVGREAETESILAAGIAAHGPTKALLAEHAVCAGLQEDWPTAAGRWADYRARFPDDPAGYAQGAAALRKTGAGPESQRLLDEGLARFPGNLTLLNEAADSAASERDYRAALALYQRLVELRPEAPRFREWVNRMQYLLREESELRGDAFEQDAPTLVQMSPEETEQALKFFECADVEALGDLFMQFEAMGYSCEVGLVQRRFGAEPIGLLRWIAFEHLSSLTAGLIERFERFDSDGNLSLSKTMAGAYDLADSAYGMGMHTFVNVEAVEPEKFLAQQTKRVGYLRRRFIEELELGEKIFVVFHPRRYERHELARLLEAFRALSPATLLYVTEAGEGDVPGAIEEIGHKFLQGYIKRRGRTELGWNIDFESWMEICRAATTYERSRISLPPIQDRIGEAAGAPAESASP